jgi:hypothetical protein
VGNLKAGASSYASIEANIAAWLRSLNVELQSEASQLIGKIRLGLFAASLVAFAVALYVVAALHDFLTTAQILTWKAFVKGLSSAFPPGWPNVPPVF